MKKHLNGFMNLISWMWRLFNANIQLFVIGCIIVAIAGFYGYYNASK